MRRKGSFQSLLLSVVLTVTSTGICGMPVQAEENAAESAVTEAVEAAETEIAAEPAEEASDDAAVEVTAPQAEQPAEQPEVAAEPVTEAEPETVAEPEITAEPEPEAAAEPEAVAEPEITAESEPEAAAESETIAEPEPEAVAEPEIAAEPAGTADAEEEFSETVTGTADVTTGSGILDDQEVPGNGLDYVVISLDSSGRMQADADTYTEDGTEIKLSEKELDLVYTLSYSIPTGWTEQEQEDFRKIMESYAAYVLEKNADDPNSLACSGVKFETQPDGSTPQLIDADKLHNINAASDDITTLDTNHCWAAATANVLWNSGWAQQAVNPVTGEAFSGEDDVMTYLSCCFTDAGYSGYYGIPWFFDGSYTTMPNGTVPADRTDIYVSEDPVDGTQQHGLLTQYDYRKIVNGDALLGGAMLTGDDMKNLSIIEQAGFDKDYYGLDIDLYHYDADSGMWEMENGHALTLMGLLYDITAENYADRYLAVLLADSDNNRYTDPSGQNLLAESPADATAKKAECINSYTLYKLKTATANLAGKETSFWYMPGYRNTPDPSYIAVLRLFYALEKCTDENMELYLISVDPDPEPEQDTDPEANDNAEQSGNAVQPEDGVDPTALTDDPDALAELVKLIIADSQKLPEMIEKCFTLRGASVYGKNYEFGTSYRTGKNRQYVFIANCDAKMLGEITLDGRVLSAGEYRIIPCDENSCTIVFSAAFMQQLSAGQHMFTFRCQGFDVPARMSVMVVE